MNDQAVELLLPAAKLRVRTKSSAFDEDIKQLILAAVWDINRIGVTNIFYMLSEDHMDYLAKEAILTFVNANFGSNPDREKLMEAYNMMLLKMKGGKQYR